MVLGKKQINFKDLMFLLILKNKECFFSSNPCVELGPCLALTLCGAIPVGNLQPLLSRYPNLK